MIRTTDGLPEQSEMGGHLDYGWAAGACLQAGGPEDAVGDGAGVALPRLAL
jgi:hypothetical protein